MGRWSNLSRRDFLGSALGATASFYVLPPGAALASEWLQPQKKFAPFQFSEEFIFGVATVAYQVEGAWNEDGKGESIWDRFVHTVGRVKGGYTGDVACDSYHRYKEDVELLKQLNCKSYRFSISWPRIQADGAGEPNQKGLDYYKRLTDELVNLAQGQAFRAIKAVNSKFEVGTAFSMSHCQPATKSEEDRKAAERAHALGNIWFVQPAMKGEYPAAFVGPNPLEMMGEKSGDMELCRAPLDFIGVNYYRRQLVSAIPPGEGESATGVHNFDAHEGPLTDFGWEVWPTGWYEMLMRISHEYKGTPMEITENGCSYLDGPDEHGRIPDDRRIQFLRGYLDELGRAMLHSCNVRAYHHWSLMDNFEWAEGYCQRFGLVYVDFRSLKRTTKESGKWYAKLAETGDLQ